MRIDGDLQEGLNQFEDLGRYFLDNRLFAFSRLKLIHIWISCMPDENNQVTCFYTVFGKPKCVKFANIFIRTEIINRSQKHSFGAFFFFLEFEEKIKHWFCQRRHVWIKHNRGFLSWKSTNIFHKLLNLYQGLI